MPLPTEADTASSLPDFIVSKGSKVFCLDSKGALFFDAVACKLLDIHEVVVRMFFPRLYINRNQQKLQFNK